MARPEKIIDWELVDEKWMSVFRKTIRNFMTFLKRARLNDLD